MSRDSPARPSRADRVRREGAKLGILVVLTAVAFLATRAAAEQMRAANVREAAAWYARAQQALSAGERAEAIDALRQATLQDRSSRTYAVSLAAALASDGRLNESEQVLRPLREATPEDPDINLQLARLAVRRGDSVAALGYYRSAMYAPWPNPDGPRRVRFELIHFLLDRGDRDRATAEVLAARSNSPDTADAHAELGALFAQAGQARLALEEYRRSLSLDAHHETALNGAGNAAFVLGDYRAAVRYLSGATTLTPDAARVRDVAGLVVSRDPLENRLGATVRRGRLVDALRYVQERLTACQIGNAGVVIRAVPLRIDQDAIEDGLRAVAAAEQVIERRCGPLTALDRALQIIAERHDTDPS